MSVEKVTLRFKLGVVCTSTKLLGHWNFWCFQFHQSIGMCMGVNKPMNMMINPKQSGFTYFSNCKVLCVWMLSIRHLNYIGDGLDFHWATQSFKNVFMYICTQGWIKHFNFVVVVAFYLCIILLDLPLKTILVFSKCGNFFLITKLNN